jgi:hypothetical protein
MPTTTNQPLDTIRAWLAQRGVTDLSEHHVAPVCVERSEVETLLSTALTFMGTSDHMFELPERMD